MTPTRRLIRQRMLNLATKIGPQKRVLEIGIAGDDPPGANREFFQAEEYLTLDKDPELKPDYCNDIENLNTDAVPMHHFNLVICSQVLEHCWRLQPALAGLWLLVAHGGHLIVDVPFMYPPHGDAREGDWWRFTPAALERLCTSFGFTVVDTWSDPDWLLVSVLARKGRADG